MYEAFSDLIDTISGYMYSYILIIMLLAVGLYFTFTVHSFYRRARTSGQGIS